MSARPNLLSGLRDMRGIGVASHFAIDLRGPTLLWARSRWSLRGWKLDSWGSETRAEGESPRDFIARVLAQCGARGGFVSVSVRHPDLRIQRLELPALSSRDAHSVVRRRLSELRDEFDEPVNAAFVLGAGRAEKRIAWLMACPSEFSEFTEQQWTSLGVKLGRLDSLHLALGALTRLFDAPGERKLRAFLDFGPVHATCVLADDRGWVFSRDLSLKTTGDPAASNDANDRIATELRRTFHYVNGELGLGLVQELVVSGEREDLAGLVEDLGARLSMPTQMLGDALSGSAAAGADPEAAVAIGLTLTTDLGGGSLLPRTAQRLRSAGNVTRRLVAVTALCALLAAGGAAHVGVGLMLADGQRAQLETAWEAARPQRERAERHAEARSRGAEIDRAVQVVFAGRPDWLASLEAIGLVLPASAVVERWNTERRDERFVGDLDVEFRNADFTEATEALAQFKTALASAPQWRVVTVQRRKAPPTAVVDALVRTRVRLEVELAPVATEHGIGEVQSHG